MNRSPFPEISEEVYSAALRLGSHPAARRDSCTVLEAVHQYTHPDGVPWWWVVRWRNTQTRTKVPLPLRRDGSGFACKRPDFGQEGAPLYRLHKLKQYPADLVYLVEGEICADCLEALGFVVTTWPGGAQALKLANLRPLAGRNVVLWPDNDHAGKDAMREALGILHALGAVALVLDVEAMSLPPKGDCVDWLQTFVARHGARKLHEIPDGHELARREIEALPFQLERRAAA
jgi:hypothetical protein